MDFICIYTIQYVYLYLFSSAVEEVKYQSHRRIQKVVKSLYQIFISKFFLCQCCYRHFFIIYVTLNIVYFLVKQMWVYCLVQDELLIRVNVGLSTCVLLHIFKSPRHSELLISFHQVERKMPEKYIREESMIRGPKFLARLRSHTVFENTHIKLFCTVEGYPTPHVKW